MLAAVALAAPAAGAPVRGLVYGVTDGTLTVALPRGGQVSLPMPPLRPGADPAHLTVTAHRATAGETRAYEAEQAAATQSAAPVQGPALAPDDNAAAYPVDASTDPGTTTTVFGGNCDGYPALDATISPLRVAVDKAGTVFWVDRDVTVARHGSALIRRLDASGRVRTLGSVVPPDTGRFDKSDKFWEFSVNVLPDDKGGVYVNSGWYNTDPYYTDAPRSGYLLHFTASGERTILAGGGERIGVDEAGARTGTARDGRPALQTWLGDVNAITRDDRGIYFAEDPDPFPGGNLVRFLNTSTEPVTFYPNTPQAVVVQPGYIATIAAENYTNDGLTTARDDAADANRPADKYYYFKVVDLAIRDQVLYTWDIAFNGVDSGPPGTSTEHDKVEALNLGFDGAARDVNSVHVAAAEVGIIAGSGNRAGGYSGDGGPARAAAFNVNWSGYNGGIAVARDGTLYIADTRNQRVRAVDPAGFIKTVAGNGKPGYDGEGTSATGRVWDPIGIDVDASGAPVFAELENARIRRLGPDGTLRTLVGRGPYPCGDGHLAAGRTAYGGAYLGRVADVATDSKGNTYVADVSYNVIRRRNAKGVVDLVIGRPTPCAAGRWGEIDAGACTEIGPRDGDGGPLSAVGLGDPRYLLVDSYDNLFVSDVDRVRYVNLLDHSVSVLGQTVPPRTVETILNFRRRLVTVVSDDFLDPTQMTLGPIGDLALDRHGALYVADPYLGVIHRLGPCGDNGVIAGVSGPVVTEGQGDGGPAKKAAVSPTAGMTYDHDRDVLLFVDHPANGAVRVRAINLSVDSLVVLGTRIAAQAIDSVVGVSRCDRDWRGCSYGNGKDARDAGTTASGIELDPATRRLYLSETSNAVRVVLPDGRIAGLAGPVPESAAPPPTIWYGAKPVPVGGYAGDGGQAANAWMTLASADVGSYGGLAVTSRGDLVVADAGRVRGIRDVDNAPLRLTATAEASVPGAGDLFTRPVQLHDGLTDADGTYAPQLRWVPSLGWVVLAARGRNRGCDAWNVLDDSRGSDVVWGYGATMRGVSGRATSGAGCALGVARGGLVAASATRVAAYKGAPFVETGVEVSTSADAKTWNAELPPAGLERAGSTTGLGEVAAGDDANGVLLAYRVADRTFVVVRRSPAGVVTTVGQVAAGAVSFGTVLALPGGRVAVAFLESGPPAPLGQHVDWVSVAEVGGGAPASVVHIAKAGEDTRGNVVASPPSLSRAPDGTLLLAFSDDRRITVATSAAAGHWTIRGRVTARGATVLPSVVAGARGAFALAYYTDVHTGSSALTAGSADPWYAAVSLFARPLSGDVVVKPLVASPQAVEMGPLCLAACVHLDEPGDDTVDIVTRPAPTGRVLGPVAAGVDGRGVLRIAYTIGPRLSGNGGDNSVVATQRLCAHRQTSAGARCDATLDTSLDDHHTVPDAPPIPEPPPVGIACSPVPPPFFHRLPNPLPRRRSSPVVPPSVDVAVPPLVAIVPPLLVAVQPPPPAPLAQTGTNVQGSTVSQPQPVAQGQTGLSTGVATDEEKQAEVATEYAFSAWLLGTAALSALACGVGLRRRTRAAPVRVRT